MDHALSLLIGDIYDCALAPDRWPHTLGELARAFRCERAILSLNDLRRDRVLIGESVGWDPGWLAERERHLPEIHAVLQSWLSQERDPDEPFVASREMPASALQSSRYVQDCLQPLGVGDVAHYFLLSSASHFSELVLMRQAVNGPFGPEELALGQLLLPHLRRAITISNVLDAKAIERERLVQTLDALPCGVVLTDHQGTIVHLNRAAGALVEQGEHLAAAAGTIRAQRPEADRALRLALQLGAQSEATMGSAGATIRLSEADGPPVFAHVLPLGGTQRRQALAPAATAAVFIGPVSDFQAQVSAFAAMHALTPAETRLVHALVCGQALNDSAQQLGVARSTAKSQLDSVFRKTNVARQSDLVRLVMQLALPAPPASQAFKSPTLSDWSK